MQSWRGLVQRVARFVGPRLGGNDRLRRAIFPIRCAPYVRGSVAFAARELTRRKTVGRYRLRESGLTVHIRHPLIDLWILYEVFDLLAYEPVPEVRRQLDALDKPPRILELGGHVGLAATYLLTQFPGAHLTTFEPDPANRAVLQRTVRANLGRAGTWKVVSAAAATHDGTSAFVSDRHLSRLGESDHPDVHMVTVEIADVFDHLDGIDLLKMDIEGGEWAILGDERFATGPKAGSIVLEYHHGGAPGGDGLAAASARLRAAGYVLGPVVNVHADGGTLWAWQPS